MEEKNHKEMSLISKMLEKELNGGNLYGQSNQMAFLAKSLRWHRTIQSELGSLFYNWIKFHARLHAENPTKYYDPRNEWIGEMCERLWRTGFLDIWSGDEKAIDEAVDESSKRFFKDDETPILSAEKILKMMEESK